MAENKEGLLKKLADFGAREVARSLNDLSKTNAQIDFSEVKLLDYNTAISNLKKDFPQKAFSSFIKVKNNINGISFLLGSREDSLVLIDQLLSRSLGTTKMIGDLEYSTLKEVLNVIGNSFINTLAKILQVAVIVAPPHIVSLVMAEQILGPFVHNTFKEIIFFKAGFSLPETKIKFDLVFLMEEGLTNLL